MTRIIETSRLVLRPWEPADIASALAIYSASSVKRWLAPGVDMSASSEDLQRQLTEWADHDRTGTSGLGHWAVALRSTSDVIGALALTQAPHASESIAIGWALTPEARGHGYATEAGNALIRWAVHEGGATEVFAIVQPDNARAEATAKRIGMEWVAELGHLPGGRYQVFRIRHVDLAWED